MQTPIIDPTSLTEEQREAIREVFSEQEELEIHGWQPSDRMIGRNACIIFEWLFGKDFFD